MEVPEKIKIVVLGDSGVGKTSLVSVYLSEEFTDEVPGVAAPVGLEKQLNNLCHIEVWDTDSKVLRSDVDAVWGELEGTHAVILVYDVVNAPSFASLDEYWLPAIDGYVKEHGRNIPVLIVGAQTDKLEESNKRKELMDEMILRRTEHLVLHYDCVERAMHCSARAFPKDVEMVFVYTTHMVVYPERPLFDPYKDEIQPAVRKALSRIFRMFDRDRDGVLSVDELGDLEQHCFHRRHKPAFVEGAIQGVRKSRSSDQVKLDETGLVSMIEQFLLQNCHHCAWNILWACNYDMKIELQEPNPPIEVGPLRPGQQYELSSEGRIYLSTLFRQFASADHYMASDSGEGRSEAGLLTTAGLSKIFSVTPSEHHAFPPSFPSCTHHNVRQSITEGDWLAMWSMLTVLYPKRAMTSLYELGYMSGKNELDPRSALMVSEPRRNKPVSFIPTRRVFVVGSNGSGKSTLITHFLRGSKGVSTREAALARGEPVPDASEGIHHYACVAPRVSEKDKKSSTFLQSDESRKVYPSYALISEIPVESWHDTVSVCLKQCDVIVFTVDQTSRESLEWCESALQDVPLGMPVVVVCTHFTQSSHQVVLHSLTTMCRKLKIEMFTFSKKGDDFMSQEVFALACYFAPTPFESNPQTSTVCAAVARKRRWRAVAALGVVAALIGVGYYGYRTYQSSDPGDGRSGLRGLWRRIRG